MKRLLDSLLSRWYVPRCRFEIVNGMAVKYMRGESVRDYSRGIGVVSNDPHYPLPGRCPAPGVVISTDYDKGIPCS